MRKILLFIITTLIVIGTLPCQAAIERFSITLTAHPQTIVADSHSTTTITADVRDSSGRSVADGTNVDFTSSLGIIEKRVQTMDGVARARLESGNITGTAIVTAVVPSAGALAEIRVDFLAPGTELFDNSFISISSKVYLGYEPEMKLIDSAGGVTIESRGLTIDAEEARINVRTNILKAKAKIGGTDIIIKRGTKQIAASVVYYDFNTMRGVFIAPPSEGAGRMLFRGSDMHVEKDSDPDTKINFDINPITDSRIFIRAKSIIIKPGDEVKIKRANYYMDGEKFFSVPLQVVPLRSNGETIERMVTYGTNGINVDLPFYFSLTPNRTGLFRVTHSSSTGWGSYSGVSGWQLNMEQEYNIGGSTDGRFIINRITSSDWGIDWNQRKVFDNNSQLYTYFNFPNHRDLYGKINYRMPFKNYTWSLDFDGNKRKSTDTDSYTASTSIQSKSRPLIGNAVNYSFSTKFRYKNGESSTGLGLQLYGKTLQFGPSTSLSTSLTASHDWGANSNSMVYGSAGLYKTLGNIGQLNLSYNYAWADALYGYSSQSISTDLSLRPAGRWFANLYSIYGLSDGSLSASGNFGYRFMDTWRLGLLSTYQKFNSSKYTDAEVILGKTIGKQEVMLIWSQSQKKLRMEVTAAGF